MVATAEYFHASEIVFPEIAALAFGAWVMEKRPWHGALWTVWLSPTLSAVTGVLVLRLFPHSLLFVVILVFLVTVIELKIFRSAMSPSFSAAILPIVTGITSFVYPFSVCVMSGIVTIVAARIERHREIKHDSLIAKTNYPLHKEMIRYGKMLFLVMLVAMLSVELDSIFIIAPPLIVAFVELVEPDGLMRQKSMPRLLILFVLAALIGTAWVMLVTKMLYGPMWLAAGLTVASVFLLTKILNIATPPAFALSLLPTILPTDSLTTYPLYIFIGSVLFISLSLLCFKFDHVNTI